MNDAGVAVATVRTHEVADQSAKTRSFVTCAGSGAFLGGIAGVAIALPLAAAGGVAVFIATAVDVAAGLALLGGLIGANFAGTD
jgi:hypothetical protein